jgi:hypothetical protein
LFGLLFGSCAAGGLFLFTGLLLDAVGVLSFVLLKLLHALLDLLDHFFGLLEEEAGLLGHVGLLEVSCGFAEMADAAFDLFGLLADGAFEAFDVFRFGNGLGGEGERQAGGRSEEYWNWFHGFGWQGSRRPL